MIREQFGLFAGVGPKRERAIRAARIGNWQEFLEARTVPGVSAKLHQSIAKQIEEWTAALESGDAAFFATTLKKSAHWTLFDEFGANARYLDIETTGLSPDWNDVTMVGIHDGKSYHPLIQGQGLSWRTLEEALEGCKLLVTYFGSAFDVPFLQTAFPDLSWDFPHFDLCFAGRKVGLKGGLKKIEKELGIARADSIADIDGFEAVHLWRAHEDGHPTALRLLIEYNKADTRNLVRIAPMIYQRLCAATGC